MDENIENKNIKQLWNEFNLPEKTEIVGGSTGYFHPSRRKKIFIYTSAILFGLIVSFFLIYFVVLDNDPSQFIGDIKSENTATPTDDLPEPTPEIVKDIKNNIAYLEDNELKIVDFYGDEVVEIKQDNFSGDVTAYEWKNHDVLTYARCSFTESRCKIFNVDMSNGEPHEFFSQMDISIVALGWSPDESILYYHVDNKKDNQYYTYYYNGLPQVIKKWTEPIGRGLSLTDHVGFDFNEEGHVLLTNTINAPDENFVTVFDKTGKELSKITTQATFAFFKTKNQFYYVSLGQFYSAADITKPLIADFEGLNLVLSPDKSKVLYWVYDDEVNDKGTTKNNSYILDLTSLKSTFVIEDFISPEWAGQNNIVGLAVLPQEGLFNYKVNALATSKSDGTELKMIAKGEISSFRISK